MYHHHWDECRCTAESPVSLALASRGNERRNRLSNGKRQPIMSPVIQSQGLRRQRKQYGSTWQRPETSSMAKREERAVIYLTINVPLLQLLGTVGLALVLLRPQIDNKRITPSLRLRRDLIAATDKVTNRIVRLGRKLRHLQPPVFGHVGAFTRPGRLIRRRHAQPQPHVLGPFVGRLGREAVWDPHEAVCQEVLYVRVG